jgi:hypothetical protein
LIREPRHRPAVPNPQYRFTVNGPGGLRVLREFSSTSSAEWTTDAYVADRYTILRSPVEKIAGRGDVMRFIVTVIRFKAPGAP